MHGSAAVGVSVFQHCAKVESPASRAWLCLIAKLATQQGLYALEQQVPLTRNLDYQSRGFVDFRYSVDEGLTAASFHAIVTGAA